MKNIIKLAIKHREPIVLLLQDDNGKIMQNKVALQGVRDNTLVGFSISDNTEKAFDIGKIIGVRHWFGLK